MIFIHNEKSEIQQILTTVQKNRQKLKWSNYVLLLGVDEGTLAWNTLTSVLVLLENVLAEVAQSDPESLSDVEQLYNASFLVPEEMDEYKRLNELDLVMARLKKPIEKNGFTILTTLNCNARCAYCFESGYTKSSMSDEIAIETARFIRTKAIEKEVRLKWFGGEPLVNTKAIDIISSELSSCGLDYTSSMISNGYLFDESIVKKATQDWKLRNVMITLDGTEDEYNRIKRYVNGDPSPYQRVLRNIKLLLESEISVTIRLNLSLENANDLISLAKELGKRFAGLEKVKTYAHLLYEYGEETERDNKIKLLSAYRDIQDVLTEYGLYKANGKLPSRLPQNHCMADNDGSYLILPTGKIAKCEHYADEYIVGDIWKGITDEKLISEYKKRVKDEQRCNACLFAPRCTLIKLCTQKCDSLYLGTSRNDLESSIKIAYLNWKKNKSI